MKNTYRPGAAGALLDEYERAIADLKKVIDTIPNDKLAIIIDAATEDENCRSIQTILSHVVHAGYGYATSIYNYKGHQNLRPERVFCLTISGYQQQLNKVFAYTESIINQLKDEELEQKDNALKIKTGWGQLYDIEQLMEHAIVHILRHRRQIEKIKFNGFI